MIINKKRIIALVMILAMLVSLSACGGKADLILTSEGSTEYVIIRADKASTTVSSAAVKLRNAFNSTTGADIAVEADSVNSEGNSKEIIIGVTNRTGANPSELLREKDFSIFTHEKRLIIMGGSDAATLEAVNYFINNHLVGDEKSIKLKGDFTHDFRYDYQLDTIKIGENNIGHYSIVIPEDADAYERYTAEFLKKHIHDTAGFNLKIVRDNEEERTHEILIGATKRTASVQAGNAELGETEYIMSIVGDKLVLSGKGYMVAGGAGELINKHFVPHDGNKRVELTLGSEFSPRKHEIPEAKSVILMIGDGMGYNQVKLTEQSGMGQFSASQLPHKGSSLTDSLSGITDSAAAGTALATGYKTFNSHLGMDRNRNSVPNVRELAQSTGAMTGVMTTENIHGATPGAFLVHHHSRNDADIIKAQIAELDVDFLGGRVGDDLVANLRFCLNKFTDANKHFFLMLEESDIDPAGHANNHDLVIKAVTRFNDSIMYAMVFTVINPDTVLIITADHETGGLKEREDGTFYFTTGGHSSAPVPVYAIGKGTEIFHDKTVENIEIAKFIASIYGAEEFGQ